MSPEVSDSFISKLGAPPKVLEWVKKANTASIHSIADYELTQKYEPMTFTIDNRLLNSHEIILQKECELLTGTSIPCGSTSLSYINYLRKNKLLPKLSVVDIAIKAQSITKEEFMEYLKTSPLLATSFVAEDTPTRGIHPETSLSFAITNPDYELTQKYEPMTFTIGNSYYNRLNSHELILQKECELLTGIPYTWSTCTGGPATLSYINSLRNDRCLPELSYVDIAIKSQSFTKEELMVYLKEIKI